MKTRILSCSLIAGCLLAAPAIHATDDFDPNFVAPRSKVAQGLGKDPSELAIKTYGVNPIGLAGAQDDEQGDRNDFYYTGFFRAPFNFGVGSNQTLSGEGFSGTKLHSPPVIPDGSYLDWRYTNLHGGPWAEIRFTYGNRKVSGNVSLATYNMTTGGYPKLAAQLGISEGFVSMNFPGIFAGGRGGLVANVGVFSARYGGSGRYDAGAYDTYLFGATKTAGQQLRLYLDILPNVTLHFEQGFGGKVEVAPFVPYELQDQNSNPVTNGEMAAQIPNPISQPWAPYGGSDWAQGDTFLHHEHLGVSISDKLFIGAHLMHEFTVDSDSFGEQYGSAKNGHLINTGFDIRLQDFFFGNGYFGFAHTRLKNPLRLGGAMEALHSSGGWAWNANFFKPGAVNPAGGSTPMTSLDGEAEGTINTLVLQYELSLAKLLWHPREFWGQDKDVVIRLFGMLNLVDSASALFDAATAKFKWGADVMWTPMAFLGLGARFDAVNPDMDNNTLSFNSYTGRVLFRTKFITQENITLQYSYYQYGKNVMGIYPWNMDGPNGPMKPDNHVITIGADMWW